MILCKYNFKLTNFQFTKINNLNISSGFNNDINSIMGNMMQDPFQQGNRNRSRNNNQMDPFGNNGMMAMHQQQMQQSPFAMMNQMMGQQMGGFGGNNFNMMVT